RPALIQTIIRGYLRPSWDPEIAFQFSNPSNRPRMSERGWRMRSRSRSLPLFTCRSKLYDWYTPNGTQLNDISQHSKSRKIDMVDVEKSFRTRSYPVRPCTFQFGVRLKSNAALTTAVRCTCVGRLAWLYVRSRFNDHGMAKSAYPTGLLK